MSVTATCPPLRIVIGQQNWRQLEVGRGRANLTEVGYDAARDNDFGVLVIDKCAIVWFRDVEYSVPSGLDDATVTYEFEDETDGTAVAQRSEVWSTSGSAVVPDDSTEFPALLAEYEDGHTLRMSVTGAGQEDTATFDPDGADYVLDGSSTATA